MNAKSDKKRKVVASSKDEESKRVKKANDFSEDDFSDRSDDESSESEDEQATTANGVGKKTWTPEEMKMRNQRTVFVGNVSVKTVEKENFKLFKGLFSKHGPVESIRFRSIVSVIRYQRIILELLFVGL